MHQFIFTIVFALASVAISAQSYIKLIPERGDTLNPCQHEVDMELIGPTVGPYVITWWDNSWQPGTGFHVENICENTILTTQVLGQECRDMESTIRILPLGTPQVYLDTIIAVLPSSPGACDGSISFHYANVLPNYTRGFASSGSGGTTTDSVFTGLCEDDYTYAIRLNGSELAMTRVSLRYAPVTPCSPFKDILDVTVPVSSPGNCDATIYYNSTGIGPYIHYIYKPVGGGAVQANGDIFADYFDTLCAGPHIVKSEIYGSDNYWTSNTIFVDNPVINDSTWGNPQGAQIDTIMLNAITNCGINYTYYVDDVFVSSMTHVAADQYEFGISVVQSPDTIVSYETAQVDTNNQLCFDVTFFCADSAFQRANATGEELHNYIHFSPDLNVGKEESDDKLTTDFVMYPVPSDGLVYLDRLPQGVKGVYVYALDGKLVYQDRFSASIEVMDLKGLAPGVYSVTVTTDGYAKHQKLILTQ